MRKCIWLLALLALFGCGLKRYRIAKALNGRVQVLDVGFEEGPRLVQVRYRAGKESPLVMYQLESEPGTENQRPPRLFSKSKIELSVSPGINPERLKLRIFVKNEPHLDGDLIEIKTIVGEIPGELPNAVTFVEDLFPQRHPRLSLYPDDLVGPYQGIRLQAHDWLVLYLEDHSNGSVQKIIFEYVPTGYRVSTGAHLLFSTGINLLDVGVAQIESTTATQKSPRRRSELASADGQIDPGGLDLALTFTAAVGYRGKARNGPRRWLSDQLTLVFDIGVGNVGEIERILSEGTAAQDRVTILQNQLLLGVGVQVFDFVSLHLLNNVVANFPVKQGQDFEAVLIPELGFDVATAVRFSRRLYERLFKPTLRRSLGEPLEPQTKGQTRLVPASMPTQALPLDERHATPY